MKSIIQKLSIVLLCLSVFAAGSKSEVYYVSPTGTSSAGGLSVQDPIDIYSAVAKVRAGDIICLLSGKYDLKTTVNLTTSGTADAPIQMTAYDAWTPFDLSAPLGTQNINTRPILSFTETPHITAGAKKEDADKARGFMHTGNYWIIKGINITDAGDNGVKLEGSHNVYELCNFWRNGDTGHQIGFSHNASDNPGLQKGAYNMMINCDSWDNWDAPDWGDADGFACKMYPGLGNEYHGCRAWNNSDDGWDCFEIQSPVILNNCWTWKNAQEPGKKGNGNGFKMGGSPSKGNHVLYRCIAWGNLARGFDQNSNSDGCYLYNCLSFDNNYNYMFEKAGGNIVVNCVEWGKKGGMALEFKSPEIIKNNSWQLFDGATEKDEAKFSKLTAHANEYIPESLTESAFAAKRNSDGSLPKVAQLKETSKFIDAGIVYSVKNPNTGEEMFNGVNDGKPDLGYCEYTPADPDAPTLIEPTNKSQTVKPGSAISSIVFTWGGAASDVKVEGVPSEMTVVKNGKTVTIFGIPAISFSYTVATIGGNKEITVYGEITVSKDGGTVEPDGDGKLVERASFSVEAKGTSEIWGPFNIKTITEATFGMQASGSSNNPVVVEYSFDGTDNWTQSGDQVRNSTTGKMQDVKIILSTVPCNVPVYLRLRSVGNYAASVQNFIIYGDVNQTTGIENMNSDKGAIVAEAYYTMTGIKVTKPESGIFVKKVIYENGSMETTKLILR